MAEVSITGDEGSEELEEEFGAPWPEEPSEKFQSGDAPIFELRSRREEIAKEQVQAFRIPRWESPEVWCDISLVEPSVLSKALEKRQKQQKTRDDWVAWAYCDVLAPAVKCIYGTFDEIPDTRFSLRKDDPTGPLTRIDQNLAVALGLDFQDGKGSASETFRKLFFSEGDLIDFANKVFKWSAVTGDEADEAF